MCAWGHVYHCRCGGNQAPGPQGLGSSGSVGEGGVPRTHTRTTPEYQPPLPWTVGPNESCGAAPHAGLPLTPSTHPSPRCSPARSYLRSHPRSLPQPEAPGLGVGGARGHPARPAAVPGRSGTQPGRVATDGTHHGRRPPATAAAPAARTAAAGPRRPRARCCAFPTSAARLWSRRCCCCGGVNAGAASVVA